MSRLDPAGLLALVFAACQTEPPVTKDDEESAMVVETDTPADTDLHSDTDPQETIDTDDFIPEDTFTDRSDTAIWVPSPVPRKSVDVIWMTACAVAPDREIQCWGDPDYTAHGDASECEPYGQGGLPTGTYRLISTAPVCTSPRMVLVTPHRRLRQVTLDMSGMYEEPIPGLLRMRRWAAIDNGDGFCGLTVHGRILCADDYFWREPDVYSPTPGRYKDFCADGAYGCAVDLNGDLVCWGPHPEFYGDLPSRDPGPWKDVDCESGYVCALTETGQVHCFEHSWEWRYIPRVGLVEGVPVYMGHEPTLPNITAISLGYPAACVVYDGGAVHCWGPDESYNPVVYPPPERADFRMVSTFDLTFCGTTPDGPYCWGDDSDLIVSQSPARLGAP